MVRAERNLPENVRYPRKKGYAKRYVRSEFRKNRLQLLLGIVFLLGIVTGCSTAGQSGEAAGNTVITTLGQYLASAGTYGESGEFLSRMLSSFGATTLILFFLFLCGLGAVFQPVVLLVLFLRGLGLGVMGVYAYSSGQAMWYLAVLLPEAILTSILMIAAAGEALRFSVRFFVQLLPEGTTENIPTPSGNIGGYLLRFLILYLLGGSIALLSGLLGVIFSSLL